MRSGRERRLGPAVRSLTDSLAPRAPIDELSRAWPTIVGEALSSHSRPSAIRAGRLTVTCSASVYAQELEMLSPTVLKALARDLPGVPVDKLSFKVGRLESDA